MMNIVWYFIAAMLAGIFATLVLIRNDIREFVNDMYEYDEHDGGDNGY